MRLWPSACSPSFQPSTLTLSRQKEIRREATSTNNFVRPCRFFVAAKSGHMLGGKILLQNLTIYFAGIMNKESESFLILNDTWTRFRIKKTSLAEQVPQTLQSNELREFFYGNISKIAQFFGRNCQFADFIKVTSVFIQSGPTFLFIYASKGSHCNIVTSV